MKINLRFDLNKVHSQEARRIMDRIIGFDLSSLLKSKIGSKSAGRVQSVTLKMIVEREKEISEFVAEEYWSFEGRIKTPKKNPQITLVKVDGKEVKLPHQEDADKPLGLLRHSSDRPNSRGDVVPRSHSS